MQADERGFQTTTLHRTPEPRESPSFAPSLFSEREREHFTDLNFVRTFGSSVLEGQEPLPRRGKCESDLTAEQQAELSPHLALFRHYEVKMRDLYLTRQPGTATTNAIAWDECQNVLPRPGEVQTNLRLSEQTVPDPRLAYFRDYTLKMPDLYFTRRGRTALLVVKVPGVDLPVRFLNSVPHRADHPHGLIRGNSVWYDPQGGKRVTAPRYLGYYGKALPGQSLLRRTQAMAAFAAAHYQIDVFFRSSASPILVRRFASTGDDRINGKPSQTHQVSWEATFHHANEPVPLDVVFTGVHHPVAR
ncbi:hypothetical protein JCM10212_002987 [Sporobolomyces blumeae]